MIRFIHRLFPHRFHPPAATKEPHLFEKPRPRFSKILTDEPSPHKHPNNTEPLEVTISQKLDAAREFLAQGETQTTKTLLQDVIDQGNQIQRREARQLLEINQQMSTLELNLSQVQHHITTIPANTTDEITTVTTSQETSPLSAAAPVYLPESKAELFHLVDKIFTVLDQELNAKGQLLEAYHQRHQLELFAADDHNKLRKNEKILVEQGTTAEQTLHEMKPTRYL